MKIDFRAFVVESEKERDGLIGGINEQKIRIDNVIKELQDKSANSLVSNYAQVFKEEAVKNANSATAWLIAGIALSIILVVALTLFLVTDLFNTSEKIVSESKVYYIYDYSKMASKFLLASVLLFVTSYALKKYSVYKHLQATNQHRENALNSYLLFSESVIGNDPVTRNNLMLQVAKAIYEHTSTGFLLGKHDENSGNGILEITKFVGDKT